MLSAVEFELEESTVRLVKLRNPWGFREWSGPWSDGSPEWTEEVATLVGYEGKADDGIFFMPLEDFMERFRDTNICCNPNPRKYIHSVEEVPF